MAEENPTENGPRSKAGYHAYAQASVVIGILAASLPAGVAKIACWVVLLPSVLAFPYMTRRFDIPMGSRLFVITHAILYSLLWLLLGANALGVQLPYDTLYVAWIVVLLGAVCEQGFIKTRKRSHTKRAPTRCRGPSIYLCGRFATWPVRGLLVVLVTVIGGVFLLDHLREQVIQRAQVLVDDIGVAGPEPPISSSS